MKDRVSANPGRFKLTPEDGSPAFYATMERADNPIEEGTPLNKSTLLSDDTAELLGLDSTATPNDAFAAAGAPSTEVRDAIGSRVVFLYSQSGYSNPLQGIAYGNGIFLTVQYNGNRAFKSQYGKSWEKTAQDMPELDSIQTHAGIAYGSGKFVVPISSSNKALYTTDGDSWTECTLPVTSGWRTIAYGDSKFVILPYNDTIALYSSDGVNWQQTTLPANAQFSEKVIYANGKFVAVGSNLALYSYDGVEWIKATAPNANWNDVAYGNGKYLAVNRNHLTSPYAMYSEDGIEWTETSFNPNISWNNITFGDGIFIVSGLSSNAPEISYSEDAENFFTAPLPISGFKSRSVSFENGIFFLLDDSGKIFYSEKFKPVDAAYMTLLNWIESI